MFEVARILRDDEIGDWVFLYPHRFLVLIDRRRGAPLRRSKGRRALDQIAARDSVLAAV